MRIRLRESVYKEQYLLEKKRYSRLLEGIIDLVDFKGGGFARHNPKISKYCLLNPENLIQALIFCVASQKVSWNIVASLFRVMYQKLLRDGHLYIKGHETDLKYDAGEWSELIGQIGKKKVISISYMWKNQKEIFSTTKSILRKWYYPSPENIEKQRNLMIEYEESLKNAKNENEVDSINKEYESKIKSMDDCKDAVIKLFDYYTSLPQLGLAKAGFAVQLVTGALGCFDSVNADLYSHLSIPDKVFNQILTRDEAGKLQLKDYSDSPYFETRVKKLKAYSDFLDIIGKEIGTSASERLWDVWVSIVSDRVNNTGKFAKDFSTLVTRGGEIVSKHNPYDKRKNPIINAWEEENVSTMTPDKISAQHHPAYLAYGEYAN
jgi:hypothetical protein